MVQSFALHVRFICVWLHSQSNIQCNERKRIVKTGFHWSVLPMLLQCPSNLESNESKEDGLVPIGDHHALYINNSRTCTFPISWDVGIPVIPPFQGSIQAILTHTKKTVNCSLSSNANTNIRIWSTCTRNWKVSWENTHKWAPCYNTVRDVVPWNPIWFWGKQCGNIKPV